MRGEGMGMRCDILGTRRSMMCERGQRWRLVWNMKMRGPLGPLMSMSIIRVLIDDCELYGYLECKFRIMSKRRSLFLYDTRCTSTCMQL